MKPLEANVAAGFAGQFAAPLKTTAGQTARHAVGIFPQIRDRFGASSVQSARAASQLATGGFPGSRRHQECRAGANGRANQETNAQRTRVQPTRGPLILFRLMLI
jgi:hypothetical protein